MSLDGVRKPDSSPVHEFSQAFVHSLFEEPIRALRQLPGLDSHSSKANQPDYVDENPIGSQAWLAQQAGSCLGSLPWYLATHSGMGALVTQLRPQASAFKLALTSSALTGFSVDTFLRPTDVDYTNPDFIHQRLANGLSSALTFTSMTAMAGCLNRPILGMVDAAFLEKHIGNSTAAKLLRNKEITSRLAGSIAGITVNAPTGLLAAHSNSLFKEGRLANDKVVYESVIASTVVGAGFGAFNKIKSPEITTRRATPPQGLKQRDVPKPLLKIGQIECYRESDMTNLEKSIQILRLESSTDALTNLPNNRAGETILRQNFYSSQRNNSPLSLLFLDLDGFKAVNDKAGHDQGDLVLQDVARKLRMQCRKQDTIYRKGGDEFVAILPDTHYEGAQKIARQIQQIINLEIEHPTAPLKVGTSIGIFTYEPWQSAIQDISELLQAADQLMYSDKQMRKSIGISELAKQAQNKPSHMPNDWIL
jgi:diguanylate cyclase (GGDEF)-like protein